MVLRAFFQQTNLSCCCCHIPKAAGYGPAGRFLASTSLYLVVFTSKGTGESPPCKRTAGPAHRTHIRTIREVRTTVTRIITDVYYEDGKEVERKVTQVASRLPAPVSSGQM